MLSSSTLVSGFLALVSLASASSDYGNIPLNNVLLGPSGGASALAQPSKRQAASPTSSLVADPQCTNGPTSRACWSNGYSIATDFDQKWPTTGHTRDYDLIITNTTCNPDGHTARTCMLINGQYPGPAIEAGKTHPNCRLCTIFANITRLGRYHICDRSQ